MPQTQPAYSRCLSRVECLTSAAALPATAPPPERSRRQARGRSGSSPRAAAHQSERPARKDARDSNLERISGSRRLANRRTLANRGWLLGGRVGVTWRVRLLRARTATSLSKLAAVRGKVICVIGTTGVGKTKLSIELARATDGEVVNGDAMQASGDTSGNPHVNCASCQPPRILACALAARVWCSRWFVLCLWRGADVPWP